MASPITKRSGIDNFWPEIAGTVEVWYFSKKCFIKHRTGEVLNNTGVPTNSQAYKMAMEIALSYK